jgi:hypothetical protein
MHEQAHAIRVTRLASGWVLFQNLPKPVRIACLQEFEATLRVFQ